MTAISVIIPAYQEGKNALEIAHRYAGLRGIEVIVALAEGDDKTDRPDDPRIAVVTTSAGRASQMNAAAAIATGEILFFHHADTTVGPCIIDDMQLVMTDSRVVGGALRLAFDEEDFLLDLIATVANIRTRLFKMPFGDQAIFVRRRLFETWGGYPDYPLMEDVWLVDQIRRSGILALLPNPAFTSTRRYRQKGPIKTVAQNWLTFIAYRLGVSPTTLARWYYR